VKVGGVFIAVTLTYIIFLLMLKCHWMCYLYTP